MEMEKGEICQKKKQDVPEIWDTDPQDNSRWG